MPLIKAIDRINHDGEVFEPSEFLDVSPNAAESLIHAKVAVIHEVTEAVPAEKSEEPVPAEQSVEPNQAEQIDEQAKSKVKAKA